jgi:hypothetical protein
VKFHTGEPLSLIDPEVNWTLDTYNHYENLTTHNNKTIKKISVSKDERFYNLELEAGLEARAQLRDNDGSFLFVIHGLSPLINDAGEHPIQELKNNDDKYDKMLAIAPGRFKFLPDSNDDPPRIRITHTLGGEGRRFEKGDRYITSVGNNHAVARVTDVKIDAVEEKATVNFVYEGGRGGLGQVPYIRLKGDLIMNRVLEASPKQIEGIELTIEKEKTVDVDADHPDLNGDPNQATLEEIEAEINQFLQDDLDKYVSVEELADWITENQKYPDYNLVVTGARYMAQRQEYETSSSVSGGLDIEARESEDRNYIFIDLPAIEKVNSLVNISRLVGDAPEPVSEVEERSLATHLAEIREAKLDVVPGGGQDVYVSIYNGDVGHGVCNNEKIYRVLRKKKDGKCIYRIVVKKGVRANGIAHGKHRKCVMFIDHQIVQQNLD